MSRATANAQLADLMEEDAPAPSASFEQRLKSLSVHVIFFASFVAVSHAVALVAEN